MNPTDYGGIIHGTTRWEPEDEDRRAYLRMMNRSQGKTCRYPDCDNEITNGASVCQFHMHEWRKVQGQVERLLARKAMWAQAREAVLAEFEENRIVSRAVRRVR